MFPDLANALPHPKEPCDSETGLIFVGFESPLTADFVVLHFASQFLKSGIPVVVFSFNHTATHYNTIAAKLGLNFGQYQKLKNVEFSHIDLSSYCAKFFTNRDLSPSDVCAMVEKRILNEIEEKLDCLIVLDGFDSLLDCDASLRHVLVAIRKVQLQNTRNSVIVTCERTVGHENAQNLSNLLSDMCETRISISPMGQGFSKDVTGSITITDNGFPRAQILVSKRSTELHFWLSDRRVNFFHPGLAPPKL